MPTKRRCLGILLGAVLAVSFFGDPARAAGTLLLHPHSVKVLRGTTSATRAEAIDAMASDGDGKKFDVTSTLRRGTSAMSYEFGIVGVKPPKALTLQWNGQPTAPCTLRLAAFNWAAGRWFGANFAVDSSAPSLQSLALPRPGRFVQQGHLRGRVSCSNLTGTFVLSTDRIRLPDELK